MKKEIKVELHKVFYNRMFVVALIIGLVFVGLDWFDHYQFIKTWGENGGTSLYTKWIGVNGYTLGCALFFNLMPLLACIPFGSSFFAELENGQANHFLCRTNRARFFKAKFIASFMIGGITIAVPLIISLAAIALICPALVPSVTWFAVTIEHGFFASVLYYTNPLLYIFVAILIDFLWGGVIACFCLATGLFVRKRYVAMALPFGVYFGIDLIIMVLKKPKNYPRLEMSPLRLMNIAAENMNPAWLVIGVIVLQIVIISTVYFWKVRCYESI